MATDTLLGGSPAPHLLNPLDWVSPTEAAQRLGRPYFTVMRWLRTGFLTECRMRTYRDRFGRWWIEMPASDHLHN